MDPSRQPGSLTEASAAQLLDRAATLDAEGGTRVSLDDLRAAALEAGISGDSFELALAEINAGRAGGSAAVSIVAPAHAPPPEAKSSSLLSTVLRRAGLVVAGSALAVLFQSFTSEFGMDSEPVMVFTLAVAAFVVAWSAITKRRSRRVLDFEVDLGVLWTAMTFSLMLANPGDVGGILGVMMPSGFLASLLGGFVVATGPAEREPEQLPERV
jgi:hypothetical protein